MEKSVGDLFLAVMFLLIIFVIIASPILFTWYIIIVGILLYYLKLLVFNNLFLKKTHNPAKRGKIGMFSFVLETIGIYFDRSKVRSFVDWMLPYILLIVAILIQEILNINPLFY